MFKILLTICLVLVSVNAKPQIKEALSDEAEKVKHTAESAVSEIAGVLEGCKGKTHTLLDSEKDACAVLYDHSHCRDEKIVVNVGYTELSFRDRNDVESVLVKKGCTLTLYDEASNDVNKRGLSYIVSAVGKDAAFGKTLSGHSELESRAESVDCKC